MSREEKINKMIEEIKIRRNDEQYSGGPFPIYHIEFDILNEEIERLNNIIKKAIDFVESMEYCGQEDYFYDLKAEDECGNDNTFNDSKYKLLEILDKGE